MAQLQDYNKLIIGEWRLTLPIVCTDGIIRTLRIEEYTNGFHGFLLNDANGKEYTNHRGYKNSKGVVTAASRWINDTPIPQDTIEQNDR